MLQSLGPTKRGLAPELQDGVWKKYSSDKYLLNRAVAKIKFSCSTTCSVGRSHSRERPSWEERREEEKVWISPSKTDRKGCTAFPGPQSGHGDLCRGAGQPFGACTCHHAMPSGTPGGQESVQGHSLRCRQIMKCKFTTLDCSGHWVCSFSHSQPFSLVRVCWHQIQLGWRVCTAVTARCKQRLGRCWMD